MMTKTNNNNNNNNRKSDGAVINNRKNFTCMTTLFLVCLVYAGNLVRTLHLSVVTVSSKDDDSSLDQQKYRFRTKTKDDTYVSTLGFCQSPTIEHDNYTLPLLYQCNGSDYFHFSQVLYELAEAEATQHWKKEHDPVSYDPKDNDPGLEHDFWGHRAYPLPPKKTALILGNSHLRQISKTIICQHAKHIAKIHWADENSVVVEFRNQQATMIVVTNTVLVYSHEWHRLVEETFIQPFLPNRSLASVDAIVLGKFTRYQEAKGTNFEGSMKEAQAQFYKDHPNESKSDRVVDFVRIDPPTMTDVARHIVSAQRRLQSSRGGTQQKHHKSTLLLSVPMFSRLDQDRAEEERLRFFDQFPLVGSRDDSDLELLDETSTTARSTHLVCHSTAGRSSETSLPFLDPGIPGALCTSPRPAADGHGPISMNVEFINTRRFIEELGLECGSDDKYTIGTCQEEATGDNFRRRHLLLGPEKELHNPHIELDTASNTASAGVDHDAKRSRDLSAKKWPLPPRSAKDQHRCAGAFGGHADLVAFDVVEKLHFLGKE